MLRILARAAAAPQRATPTLAPTGSSAVYTFDTPMWQCNP
jgi:hypothetical protein